MQNTSPEAGGLGACNLTYKLSSFKLQASKPSAKGSSFKPESTSSRIRAPGYKRTSLPRAQATRI